jgi:4-hydroxy-tetrahydrodipicolinate synthase
LCNDLTSRRYTVTDRFEGVYAVISTPFDQSGDVDERALRSHVRFLLDEGGVQGIIPTGSTGEFAALSAQERGRVVDTVLDEVDGQIPVVVGTAAVSTRDTVSFSQAAQKAGADGLMVVAPYYCHPGEKELYEHYRTLAANVDIPIMIYNNPSTSGVDMQPPLIARLAELAPIRYVKESSGDIHRVAEIRRLCGDQVTIFCGADNLALEMFAMGVRAWVAPPANFVPQQCVRLYKLAVVERDMDRATDLYLKLLPLFNMLESTGRYVQLAKAGLEILGRPVGAPRRPLLPATDKERQQLKQLLEDLHD